MSNEHQRFSRDHNMPPVHDATVYVEKTEVRSHLRGKEAFSLHGVEIRIKVPYNPEVNQILKTIKAAWKPDKKFWVLPVGRFHDLKPHIDLIEAVMQEDWHDRVNAGLNEHDGNLKLFVGEDKIEDYPQGGTIFRKGREWTVNYIGRRRMMDDGKVKYPVWIKRMSGAPLDTATDDDFMP